jgi:hypothetical protein
LSNKPSSSFPSSKAPSQSAPSSSPSFVQTYKPSYQRLEASQLYYNVSQVIHRIYSILATYRHSFTHMRVHRYLREYPYQNYANLGT